MSLEPALVVKHPAQSAVPTNTFVCDTDGMVVVSVGTYDDQARADNLLLHEGAINPCLGDVMSSHDLPRARDESGEGIEVLGNRVALEGALEPGLSVR